MQMESSLMSLESTLQRASLEVDGLMVQSTSERTKSSMLLLKVSQRQTSSTSQDATESASSGRRSLKQLESEMQRDFSERRLAMTSATSTEPVHSIALSLLRCLILS